MEAFEEHPNLCLNFLTLPLPARPQLILLLKQKLHAFYVLNNAWSAFDLDYKMKFLVETFDEATYLDGVRESGLVCLKQFVQVAQLRESLKLVIPAMQSYDRRISKLVARVIYDCLVFENTVFPQALVKMDAVISYPGNNEYFW